MNIKHSKTMNKSIEKIPTYALPYLVNGDPTNLTDEEQQEIDNIIREQHIEIVSPNEDAEPYFSSVPFFGLPTEVEDCTIIYHD